MKYDYVIEGMDMILEYDDKKAEKKGKTAAEKTAAIIAIRELAGMNRKDFAAWLKIPYRTMSDWEHGLREMPDYVLHLIAYKVRMEIIEKRGD